MSRKNPFDEPAPTKAEIVALVHEMEVHLVGKSPMLQGIALADLTAMYFAGHDPETRQIAYKQWLDLLRGLIQVNEKILLERYGQDVFTAKRN